MGIATVIFHLFLSHIVLFQSIKIFKRRKTIQKVSQKKNNLYNMACELLVIRQGVQIPHMGL
jgi:hypothetical protein